MKLFLILALLLCAAQTQAQPDYSKLPTLPVWYELNNTDYGQAMTYLPNFDTARKGFNALTQYQGGGKQNGTWYNRFRGDTENMFQWSTTFYGIFSGDFDGNGVTDYIGGSREVYKGIESGRPPQQPPVAGYAIGHSSAGPFYIADFNNDGKDDALIRASGTPEKSSVLGSILLGNADLTKLEVIPLPHTYDSTECIIDAYALANGEARLLTLRQDADRRNSTFVLWNLTFVSEQNTIVPRYRQLARKLVYTEPDFGIISQNNITFHSRDRRRHVLLHRFNVVSLDNDLLEIPTTLTLSNPIANLTIESDTAFRWICLSATKDSNGLLYNYLLQGDLRTRVLPYAKIPNAITPGAVLRNVCPTGDVNGDGFDDLAAYYSGLYMNVEVKRFVMFLGIGAPTGVKPDIPEQRSALVLEVSNPAKRAAALRLTLRTTGAARLELYALGGERIAELWRGTTDGETRTVEAALPALAPGMYNLRLTDGRTTLDKALLITE